MDFPNKTHKWMLDHVCQDPTCAEGDCTLDRWYPRAPLSGHVRQTIIIGLQTAFDRGAIAPIEYRLALIELERDGNGQY